MNNLLRNTRLFMCIYLTSSIDIQAGFARRAATICKRAIAGATLAATGVAMKEGEAPQSNPETPGGKPSKDKTKVGGLPYIFPIKLHHDYRLFTSIPVQHSSVHERLSNIREIIKSGKAQKYPHYSFYYISGLRADIYLHIAKSILNECLEQNKRKETIKRTALDLIEYYQLQAAHECAQWIVPTFEILKSKFDQAEPDLKKHFSWGITKSGKIPIVIQQTKFFPGSSIQYIDINQQPFNIKSAAILMNPIWKIGDGSWLLDKDILQWFLYHESSHLLESDFLHRFLFAITTKNPDQLDHQMNYQQELEADIYAYKISKPACVGGIKMCASCVELERTKNLTQRQSNGYPSYSERLAVALKYAKERWGMSQEECQQYVLEGEQFFKDKLKK